MDMSDDDKDLATSDGTLGELTGGEDDLESSEGCDEYDGADESFSDNLYDLNGDYDLDEEDHDDGGAVSGADESCDEGGDESTASTQMHETEAESVRDNAKKTDYADPSYESEDGFDIEVTIAKKRPRTENRKAGAGRTEGSKTAK